MKEFIKYNWKLIVIGILIIFNISTCSKKNSYKRLYKAECSELNILSDSLNCNIDSIYSIYNTKMNIIDSLNNVIDKRNNEITSLKYEIEIYKEQNNKLANKPVVVKVTDNK